MKIVWSPFSLKRLTAIAEFIAEDSPGSSKKIVNSIFEQIEKLKIFPFLGKSLPGSKNSLLRESLVGSFRVIYRIDEDRIVILTIRHVRQSLWENNEL